MHHTDITLKKFHFYVNNQFFNDNFDVLEHRWEWDILVKTLTTSQDFSGSYLTETLVSSLP